MGNTEVDTCWHVARGSDEETAQVSASVWASITARSQTTAAAVRAVGPRLLHFSRSEVMELERVVGPTRQVAMAREVMTIAAALPAQFVAPALRRGAYSLHPAAFQLMHSHHRQVAAFRLFAQTATAAEVPPPRASSVLLLFARATSQPLHEVSARGQHAVHVVGHTLTLAGLAGMELGAVFPRKQASSDALAAAHEWMTCHWASVACMFKATGASTSCTPPPPPTAVVGCKSCGAWCTPASAWGCAPGSATPRPRRCSPAGCGNLWVSTFPAMWPGSPPQPQRAATPRCVPVRPGSPCARSAFPLVSTRCAYDRLGKRCAAAPWPRQLTGTYTSRWTQG
jgi:hypothetical protein